MRLRNNETQNPVILIVDDTPANLTLLRNILEPESYKVLMTTSGEKALKLLERVTPDLILLDVLMPELDGFETLALIKKMPSCKDVPVIFVTAKSEVTDIVRGFELGAVDYITKPLQRLETLARARSHLKIQHLLRVERRQSEQIRAIINNISDCVLVCDQQGNIQSANPATEYLFGCNENELCQKKLAELLNFTDPPEDFMSVLLHQQNDHPWWQHPSATSKNGREFAIEVNAREMFTEQPSFVVVIQDISLYRHEIDQLHLLSETDPLTNIHNRRHFEILLTQNWQQCKRNKQPLSLLFIDVDFFKSYNDQYGHQTGDSCLKQIASTLSDCLSRAVDSISRYGGEEFVAILPDTDSIGASKLAEKMRLSVEQLKLEHQLSEFKFVTVSIGIACSNNASENQPIENVKTLLKQADNALYQAKSQGRNKVVF